ncbi:MAG: thiamine phosphate synthase [Puia sp.]|nr:thiamine phosphate synthase [Puia sp.]
MHQPLSTDQPVPVEPASPAIRSFELMVITRPDFFFWESDYLKALLEAGLQKLHLRKPRDNPRKMVRLLRRLAPRWHSRLVLHGDTSLAPEYGIPQVHYSYAACKKMRELKISPRENLPFSTSLHHWEEMDQAESGLIPNQEGKLKYVFISPLFENLSKKSTTTTPNKRLLQRPAKILPCGIVGLGGISSDNIGQVLAGGWDGAAMLGWIWEEPKKSVERFRRIQQAVDEFRASPASDIIVVSGNTPR